MLLQALQPVSVSTNAVVTSAVFLIILFLPREFGPSDGDPRNLACVLDISRPGDFLTRNSTSPFRSCKRNPENFRQSSFFS